MSNLICNSKTVPLTKEMYLYEISVYYYEGDERKYFCKEVEAPNNIVAMQMVLGEIMWQSNKYFNDASVKLECMHYKCL